MNKTAFTGGIIALVIFVGGISRLELDQPSRNAVTADSAEELARCLPKVEIPVGETLTLLPMEKRAVEKPKGREEGKKKEDITSPSDIQLDFIATAQIALDISPESVGMPAVGISTQDINPRDISIRLIKTNGTFELKPNKEEVLLRRIIGTTFFRSQDSMLARFGPTDGAIYEVIVNTSKLELKDIDGKKKVVLPSGTKGSVLLGTGQAVSSLQPLLMPIWVPNASPTLMPVRVSGQPGLSDISIEVNQPGLRFDNAGVSVSACARSSPGVWTRAGVSETKPGTPGSAKVLIALPDGALPGGWDRLKPIEIAVATSDGRYIAVGGFNALGRLWAALGATLVTALLLGSLMYHRGQQLKKDATDNPPWFSGLFTGPDRDPSLSLFQIFVWTIITVWGFLYVFIVAGNLLTLTPEMMGLLGIAGIGTVLARWIAISSGGSTSQNTVPSPKNSHMFWQMLSTNGTFDLLKLQLFIFTIVIAMYVVWRICDSAAFPALDANTLLLMGVSQGVYVTGKFASTSLLSRAQSTKAEIDVLSETLKNLEDERKKLAVEKTAADTDAAAAGNLVPDTVKKRQDELTIDIASKDQLITVAQGKIAALKLDFDKSLGELGFK